MHRFPHATGRRLLAPWRHPLLRWGVLAAAVLTLVAVLLFHRALGSWLWPDTRIQQLLARGDAALAQGRLSADDGSGARELYAAALALDGDRDEARAGLQRTGIAALAQGHAALARHDLDGAATMLALARALQVPQAQTLSLATPLRVQQARRAGIDGLLAQAAQARRQGRLDGTGDSALPLYQRVLTLAPERTDALEGREDALADLIQQAWSGLNRGRLAEAAPLLAAARGYDPGHADLPAAQAEFNRLLEQRRRDGEAQLRRGRLDAAATSFADIAAAQPEDAEAQAGPARVASAFAARAAREAADFQFAAAEASLQRARALAADAAGIAQAEQALARARAAHDTQFQRLAPAVRERRLRALLAQVEHAESAQDWLTPPGASAYDRLRAAQALAPDDARVRRAIARIVPATRDCFEDELRGNRLRAARVCLDAWQAMAPREDGLAAARTRLAQRWLAVGSERLRAEDVAFARQSLEQARQLDPRVPGLSAFAAQVHAAAPRRVD